MNEYILTFNNTHDALRCEKALKDTSVLSEGSNGSVLRLIPTPRQIHSECGFSLLVRMDGLFRQLPAGNMYIQEIYKITTKERGKTYELENS